MSEKKFGAFVPRARDEQDIGLREMAKMTGVNPIYLSKVERDEFAPPAEDKVKRNPVEVAALLRTTNGLTADKLTRLCDRLEASLTDTATIRRRLLDALLAEALAPVDARELEAAE